MSKYMDYQADPKHAMQSEHNKIFRESVGKLNKDSQSSSFWSFLKSSQSNKQSGDIQGSSVISFQPAGNSVEVLGVNQKVIALNNHNNMVSSH